MAECGIKMDRSTINRWVVKYVLLLVVEVQRHKKGVNFRRRFDEAYIVEQVPGGSFIDQFNSLAV